MKLKYGKKEVRLPIQDKNIIKILNLKKQKIPQRIQNWLLFFDKMCLKHLY